MRRIARSLIARAAMTALAVALLAVILSGTGMASAARRAAGRLVDGHPLVTKPRAGGILVLGKDHRFPAAALPAVAHARTAKTANHARTADTARTARTARTAGTAKMAGTAKTAGTAATATSIAGKSLAQVTASCPEGTVDIGTWCLMINPYPIAAGQLGLNNYFWASQACVAIGGYLPDAGELIGAAAKVKLESTIDDNPSTATVQGSDGSGPELDQREMSASLVTTQAGSDAAGSEGVTPGAHPDPTSGQPDPAPAPAVPSPPTLQYVTVYSNGTKGGFAGSEPVGSPENFRCGFDLKQSVATPSSSSAIRERAQVLRRSLSLARPARR